MSKHEQILTFTPASIAKMSKCAINSLKQLPESPGIYFLIDDVNRVYYVGKAINLRQRLSKHDKMADFECCAQFVAYSQWLHEEDLDRMERQAIVLFDPPLNSNLRQRDQFLFAKTGLDEEQTVEWSVLLKTWIKLFEDEYENHKTNLITIFEKNNAKYSAFN